MFFLVSARQHKQTNIEATHKLYTQTRYANNIYRRILFEHANQWMFFFFNLFEYAHMHEHKQDMIKLIIVHELEHLVSISNYSQQYLRTTQHFWSGEGSLLT